MTTVKGNVTDVVGTAQDVEVLISSTRWRGGFNNRVISDDWKKVPTSPAGVFTIDNVEPGPARFWFRGEKVQETVKVTIPNRGTWFLSDLMQNEQPWTPALISTALQAKIDAEAARDKSSEYANASKTYRDQANAAKTAAEAARDRAAGSASAAAGSATAAGKSASAAAGSASAAAGSAKAAATSATAAAGSANTAKTAASQAESSKSAAAVSANTAKSYTANIGTAKAAAEAAARRAEQAAALIESKNLPSAYSDARPNTLMKRDAAGRAQVANPSAAADIATKAYVDAGDSSVRQAATAARSLAQSVKSVVDAATNVKTPNTLVKRHSSGTIQAADPNVAADVATKGYVDRQVAIGNNRPAFYMGYGGPSSSSGIRVGDAYLDASTMTIYRVTAV